MLHVFAHLAHVVVVELDDEERHLGRLRAVERLKQFAPHGGQLVVEKVGVGAAQVVGECCHRHLWQMFGRPSCPLLHEVGQCQEGGSVYVVLLAHLRHRFVGHAEGYAEAAHHLQQGRLVAYHVAHAVGALVVVPYHVRRQLSGSRHRAGSAAKLRTAGHMRLCRKQGIFEWGGWKMRPRTAALCRVGHAMCFPPSCDKQPRCLAFTKPRQAHFSPPTHTFFLGRVYHVSLRCSTFACMLCQAKGCATHPAAHGTYTVMEKPIHQTNITQYA